jgi:hypothetical protein
MNAGRASGRPAFLLRARGARFMESPGRIKLSGFTKVSVVIDPNLKDSAS